MARYKLISLLIVLAVATASPAGAQTEQERKVVTDCSYETRVALGHSGEISARLYELSLAIAERRTWSDPDRGLILGYVAASPCGSYATNLPHIRAFAAAIGTTVKPVSPLPPPPTPPPVVVVPPAPAASGVIEAEVRRIVKEELAKLAPSGTVPAVAGVVEGDLVVKGRICMPYCYPTDMAQVQIHAQWDAEIALHGNLAGRSNQGPEEHCNRISSASDGGIRVIHNNRHVVEAGVWKMVWCEPAKPRTILAFDSQGTLSLSNDYNGRVYPSQTIVFRDVPGQYAAFTSMKPGTKLCIGWSTTINDFANLWCPPVPNSAGRRARATVPADTATFPNWRGENR